MYPNPQDVLPLPPKPNLEQYRTLAKELVKACKSGHAGAVKMWARNFLERLAKLQKTAITSKLLDRIKHDAVQIEQFARNKLAENCALTDAQFVVARVHGFESWPKFAKHIEELARQSSGIAAFERAADAVIDGDAVTLKNLLREHPELIRERSTREHRATLLHYVAANGVENYRQKTPKNIVEIAGILLKAGAEIDATAEMYGGGATTLGLVATSVHPEQAGVQIALMELLLEYGGAIDAPASAGNKHSAVNGCLANGRQMAAEYLASRGAHLDLEGAAGVGRLDLVKSFFNEDGTLKPTATEKQMRDGFGWACEYGRTTVADFLLQRGIQVDAKLRPHAQTGLHFAAAGGHVELVKLLLEYKAPVNVRDESFEATPLGWALYGWMNPSTGVNRESYYEVVRSLVEAGAIPEPRWLGADPDQPQLEELKTDPKMLAALANTTLSSSE
jgi:hypothetical protein